MGDTWDVVADMFVSDSLTWGPLYVTFSFSKNSSDFFCFSF